MRLALALVLVASVGRGAAAAEPALAAVRCGPSAYAYLLFSPDAKATLPAILVLHGAGGRAIDALAPWRKLAETRRIVLVAPEIPRDEAFEPLAPLVFRCIVEDARRHVAIDARRTYLFGHSMGGYLGFDTALLQSEFFAAAAIHAAAIADEYVGIIAQAKRKIPIAIYIGDRDSFFPIEVVRKTRDLLQQAGFPLHYVEIANHTHDYFERANDINVDAWSFLSTHALR